MLNKSLIWQKMAMQQHNIDYQSTRLASPSQAQAEAYMGRILIEELQQAAGVVDFKEMLNQSALLAQFTQTASNTSVLLDDLASMTQADTLSALIAIEPLAAMQGEEACKVLIECLSHTEASVRRQTSWKLANRPPSVAALPLLLAQLGAGGIDTMHAHETLNHWAKTDPELIIRSLSKALITQGDALVRARLVDLLGTLDGSSVNGMLTLLAADSHESVPVRLAAISAIGSRTGPFNRLLAQLKQQDNDIGAYATLAINDQQTLDTAPLTQRHSGLRMCQLVLAKVDETLSSGGCGETGGVASLLVSLGDALARQPNISQVLTIGLGSVDDAISSLGATNHTPQPYGIITAGDDIRPMNSTNAWEHLPVLKRSIKRCLGNFGAVDVIHLRMLDAATFAAADVAHSLSIPICFSFAPDPQNTVQALHAGGSLSGSAFVNADAQSNLWFRARMLEQMGRNVSHVALFPQPKCKQLLQAIRKDVKQHKQHSVTIAEGIDIQLIRQAALHYADENHRAADGVINDLANKICPSRRHLPLLLSVGRFHPIKGMARIASAWAQDPLLYKRCNLVLVGGNLSHPSMVEMAVMEAIDSAVPIDDYRRAGIILMGGRPRADIAQLMAATMIGRPDNWAAGGIYVDGALKEEFGLALIEALATGLVVVAPSTGGPSTYVDHGDTGILVDPEDDLGTAIHEGFALVERSGRSLKARHMVEEHYAIDTMAEKLTELYLTVRDKP
jgi:glycosyltransferase involved in cell wall biosynthesis